MEAIGSPCAPNSSTEAPPNTAKIGVAAQRRGGPQPQPQCQHREARGQGELYDPDRNSPGQLQSGIALETDELPGGDGQPRSDAGGHGADGRRHGRLDPPGQGLGQGADGQQAALAGRRHRSEHADQQRHVSGQAIQPADIQAEAELRPCAELRHAQEDERSHRGAQERVLACVKPARQRGQPVPQRCRRRVPLGGDCGAHLPPAGVVILPR
jgi:hypothetical protein